MKQQKAMLIALIVICLTLVASAVAGILNAPALNPLRRVFVFIFNAFEVLDGAGIESKILK